MTYTVTLRTYFSSLLNALYESDYDPPEDMKGGGYNKILIEFIRKTYNGKLIFYYESQQSIIIFDNIDDWTYFKLMFNDDAMLR